MDRFEESGDSLAVWILANTIIKGELLPLPPLPTHTHTPCPKSQMISSLPKKINWNVIIFKLTA